MSIDPPRQPAGVPTGGQFAAVTRAEPDLQLPVDINIPIATVGTVRDTSASLPPWPRELPTPEVSYIAGPNGPDVTVRWGQGPGEYVEFWTDDEGDDVNSFTDSDTPEDLEYLESDVAEAVRRYGATVHRNLQMLSWELVDAAHTPEARGILLALATKQPVPTPTGPAVIESRIGAWTGNPHPGEPEVRQVLADLRAYTRSVGVSDEAFERLVAESAR